jgi:4-hydroxythreonine-4-phosphate dehydrogenase
VIAITPGEPAGVGPDLCVQIASRRLPARLVVVADRKVLLERARALGVRLRTRPFRRRADAAARPGELLVLHVPAAVPVRPGAPDPANGRYVLRTLEIAAEGCRDGLFDALVTGPVQKSAVNEAGIEFTGHTEYLAARLGADTPVMMLVGGGLRVALATTHLPLREVARRITRRRLERTLAVVHRDLVERFGIVRPRIAVAGLNPHAGEAGYLGREEIEVIVPVLEKLRREGLRLEGPLPADTIFTPRRLRGFDCVLAMYHDQGLPVLKHAGFGRAVNVTLGLPIVRTSVDHGTALDLAGTGRASPGSLVAAIRLAAALVRRARRAR